LLLTIPFYASVQTFEYNGNNPGNVVPKTSTTPLPSITNVMCLKFSCNYIKPETCRCTKYILPYPNGNVIEGIFLCEKKCLSKNGECACFVAVRSSNITATPINCAWTTFTAVKTTHTLIPPLNVTMYGPEITTTVQKEPVTTTINGNSASNETATPVMCSAANITSFETPTAMPPLNITIYGPEITTTAQKEPVTTTINGNSASNETATPVMCSATNITSVETPTAMPPLNITILPEITCADYREPVATTLIGYSEVFESGKIGANSIRDADEEEMNKNSQDKVSVSLQIMILAGIALISRLD
jgi:hypothetical protein